MKIPHAQGATFLHTTKHTKSNCPENKKHIQQNEKRRAGDTLGLDLIRVFTPQSSSRVQTNLSVNK